MKTTRSKRARYLLALAAGLVAGGFMALLKQWEYVPLAAWDIAALVIISVIAWDMHSATAKMTAVTARRDDMNRSLSDIIVLFASLVSIGAVVYLFLGGNASIIHIAFGLTSIVISWATVHMLYALRYAALYYSDPEGGIDFNANEKPRFSDFLYMAFTVGMTYQIADTDLNTSKFRQVVLGHAVISFIFGTTIIATTINFIASLSK